MDPRFREDDGRGLTVDRRPGHKHSFLPPVTRDFPPGGGLAMTLSVLPVAFGTGVPAAKRSPQLFKTAAVQVCEQRPIQKVWERGSKGNPFSKGSPNCYLLFLALTLVLPLAPCGGQMSRIGLAT